MIRMPAYDYYCDANGRTLELRHGMNERVSTWGELCLLLGIEPGDTRPAEPVRKLIRSGGVVRSENLGSGAAPPCASGPCCGGGLCEM
jgi:hypothetical protein